MQAEQVLDHPHRPAQVAEWEELLLRLEIVPRVVRNAIEDAADREGGATALRGAIGREAEVGARLEAAAGLDPRQGPPAAVDATLELEELAFRFAALRARTFAMVQRRGLEVWEWSCELREGHAVSVYQLLLWLAAQDGELLAELRRASRSTPAGC